tara:strand:+ start:369 stop:1565 length:1197 start_codon:yes stop_codon:yes gene_type:complete
MNNIYNNLYTIYQSYALANNSFSTEMDASEFSDLLQKWNDELLRTRETYIEYLSNSPISNHNKETENIQILNLVALMGELWDDISPHHSLPFNSISNEYNYLNLNLHFYNSLEDLLSFYESFINNIQSQNLLRDRIYSVISQRYIVEHIPLLQDKLEEFIGDEILKRVVFSAFLNFSNLSFPKTSNFDFIHLKRLLREICFNTVGTETESNLYTWCIFHNFNTLEFYEYATENFLEEIYLPETMGASLQKANDLLISLKQLNVLKDRILVPNLEATSIFLAKWLKQEINKIQTKIESNSQSNTSNKSTELSEYTITTNLSVGQLSVLTEAFIETNVFHVNNKSLHNRFLAKYFLTTKGKNFSPISLRTNQKDVSEKHLKDLKQKLLKCIEYIENFNKD